MKIALAQINTTIGDFSGNTEQVRAGIRRAKAERADLVLFPELCLTGYPPRDLVEQKHFVDENLACLQSLIVESEGIGAIIGFVAPNATAGEKSLWNAAAFIADGEWRQTYAKQLLPTYDVFDEGRHFASGTELGVIEHRGKRLGLTICEDIWNDKTFWENTLYARDPVAELVKEDIDIIINISASPYGWEKEPVRREMMRAIARRHARPIYFCNLVGGNDELVFDGKSAVFTAQGDMICEAAAFQEDFVIVDEAEEASQKIVLAPEEPSAEITQALVLGVRDYARKCGFQKAVLGLSGGIDSSLTAVIAAEALGADNILGVMMPSIYTSESSIKDAAELAKNIGIETWTLPIDDVLQTYKSTLARISKESQIDTMEENLQARIRGNFLMAISNELGYLVLSTGNKSELSVGYVTLYGDMCGGLAVLSDIPKTLVYELAHWANRGGVKVPENVFTKPPSAELKPNQCDQDVLPPYDILDGILKGYIEEHLGPEALVAQGYDPATVDAVIRMIIQNEYKRRQMAVGIKISKKAFGIGWRFPIARKKS